jgi:hypothetical protein
MQWIRDSLGPLLITSLEASFGLEMGLLSLVECILCCCELEGMSKSFQLACWLAGSRQKLNLINKGNNLKV